MSIKNSTYNEDDILHALVDNAPIGAVLTRGNDVLYFNQTAVALLGYSQDDLPTMEEAFSKFYPDPAYREQVMQTWFSKQLGSAPCPEQVVRVRCKDGGDKYVSFSPPIPLPDGRHFTAFIDVSAREFALEELKQRDAILDALAKSARDFVVFRIRIELDLPFHGVVEFVTESISDLFRLSNPMEYAAWFEHVHPEDLERVVAANRRSAKSGVKFDEEVRVRDPKLDSWRWIHTVANPVVGPDGRVTHFTGTIVDLTAKKRADQEKRELEAKVRRARELEALGTLASGVAHDFNNLLMAIGGSTSLALAIGSIDDQVADLLRGVERQVQRGSELTGQLLGCARSGSYELKELDLAVVVNEIAGAFGRIHKQLQIQLRIPDEPVLMSGNQAQLSRALLNIFVNAAEAMSENGVLQIELDPECELDAVMVAAGMGGEYACLSVRDNGHGMDVNTRERVFEPFFTTKNYGKGTGLGLSMVYGIVQAHGGHIDVESSPGEGAVFRILLPKSGQDVVAGRAPRAVVRGSGTILVVDDEVDVLEVVSGMLRKLGYKVLAANSGTEALSIYEANTIDLVVLDVIMPGIGGEEVYRKLAELNPSVRVLFSSGRGEDLSNCLRSNSGQLRFIPKPYTIAELSQEVSRALA